MTSCSYTVYTMSHLRYMFFLNNSTQGSHWTDIEMMFAIYVQFMETKIIITF